MPVLLAASRPATAALARIRSRQRNSCINLLPQTQIAATKANRSSPATSSTPARNLLDRVLSTQAHHPRRSNPHSARGATTRSPIAVSFLGGFRPPAAQVRGNRRQGPASETLHTFCHVRRSKKAYSITSSARPRSVIGNVSPSAFAVLRLRANSTFTVCCTGKSAGFSPLRMRPT
jgi:hypothetical protein